MQRQTTNDRPQTHRLSKGRCRCAAGCRYDGRAHRQGVPGILIRLTSSFLFCTPRTVSRNHADDGTVLGSELECVGRKPYDRLVLRGLLKQKRKQQQFHWINILFEAIHRHSGKERRRALRHPAPGFPRASRGGAHLTGRDSRIRHKCGCLPSACAAGR